MKIVNAKQLAHEFGVPPISMRYILRAKYKAPGEKRRTWNFTEQEAKHVRKYVATVLGRKPIGAGR